MRPMPLKWRVSLLVGMAVLVTVAGVSAGAYLEMKELIMNRVDRTLSAMAQGCAAILDDPDPMATRVSRMRSLVGSDRDKHSFFRISGPGLSERLTSGRLPVDSAQLDADLQTMPPPDEGHRAYFAMENQGRHFRAVRFAKPSPAGRVDIVVGVTTSPEERELQELLNITAGVGGAVAIVAVLLVTLLVRLGLRPISDTAARLSTVTASNVGQFDPSLPPPPVELRPFVESLAKMLGRLDSAMRQQKSFIADASHELRTPLANTKSTIQLALSRPRSVQEYQRALEESLEDLRRMERLAAELLVLARLDESPAPATAVEVDLQHLLAGVAEEYQSQAAAKGYRLDCPLSPAMVSGQENELRRLFVNLVENAIHHGPRQGTITLAMAPDGNGSVVARVTDEGGAIPPEALGRLFDRFYRADASRSSSTGGAGLGLAIARQIVLRHGGQITITSDKPNGTVVQVRLQKA